eukprot:gene2199-2373_t
MSVASYIERILEESAIPVNELVQKEYITTKEAASIFRQRRSFESKILSHDVVKEHYLNYLNFEINLLLLIKTRSQVNGLPKLEKWDKVCKHIATIFERGLKKYRTDELLWKSYLDWSIEYNFKVEHHFESALQMNPDNESLWILATKWQVEVNQSPETARNLFQRAVKLIPSSENLWLAFFKFETLNAIELMEEDDEDDDKKDIEKVKPIENPTETYKVALLIYDQIDNISLFKNNYKIRFEMLNVLNYASSTETIQNFILEKILKKFSHDEECVMECLTFKFKKKLENKKDEDLFEYEKETILHFNEAAKVIPSKKFFECYSRFCLESIERNKHKKKNYEYLMDHLINDLYYNVNLNNMFSESLYMDYCYILIFLGYFEIAKETLSTAILEFPTSFKLIKLYLSFLLKLKTDQKEILGLFQTFLKKFDLLIDQQDELSIKTNKQNLWFYFIDYLKENCDKETTKKFMKNAMIGCNTFEMKRKCFEWFTDNFGVKGAREASSMIIQILPNEVEVYRMLIEYETSLKEKDISQIVVLYDSIIQQCGDSNEDIWIEYIQLMNSIGNLRKSHNLYYLATKTLKNVQPFIQKYEKIK